MANAIYPKYKEHVLSVTLGSSAKIVNPLVYAILLDTNDEVYNAADEFLSDITAAGIVATSPALGSLTFTNGVLKAANTTWTSVTGDVSEACLIVVAPTSGATSSNTRLVAFIDSGITGSPVTPNGGDINCNFDTGANGIFAI